MSSRQGSHRIAPGDRFNAHILKQAVAHGIVRLQGFWDFKAYFPFDLKEKLRLQNHKSGPINWKLHRQLKWADGFENLVVNQALDHILDIVLSGGTQLTSWFLALINGSSPTIIAADTYASHGFTENTNYDEATRPQWVDAGAASQSISNTASPATFTISANSQTIGGAFLVSFSTKGNTAQAGARLYAAGAFASAKALDDNETLDVTATFTAADDGV